VNAIPLFQGLAVNQGTDFL